jgi:hypothetical protein
LKTIRPDNRLTTHHRHDHNDADADPRRQPDNPMLASPQLRPNNSESGRRRKEGEQSEVVPALTPRPPEDEIGHGRIVIEGVDRAHSPWSG